MTPTSPLMLQQINGKDYFGDISDEEAMYLWVNIFSKKKGDL